MKEWEKQSPGDNLYFKLFQIISKYEPKFRELIKNSLLLVHQTKWQSDLNKYRREIQIPYGKHHN